MTIWKKSTQLEITCKSTNSEDTLVLYYNILDIDIADRWLALIEQNKRREHSLRYNYRKILSPSEIENTFVEFKNNINYINNNYDIQLTDPESVEYLREHWEILNDLHEQFEVYGDRLADLIETGYFNNPKQDPRYNEVWPGMRQNKVLHEAFLRLNEQIHNFEAIYRTWDNSHRSVCTCLVDFMPAGLHEPLQPEDYLLFTPEHYWGWLYLGYNTLGKHWSSACHDNDVEVVRRNQIRPQARFAAEMYMNFKDTGPSTTRIELYKWWLENNFSEVKDPRMLLEELALGFIPVGKIIGYKINTDPYVDINSVKETNRWNLMVWSKFNSIESINIVNSNE